jgi:hypothetical protein
MRADDNQPSIDSVLRDVVVTKLVRDRESLMGASRGVTIVVVAEDKRPYLSSVRLLTPALSSLKLVLP